MDAAAIFVFGLASTRMFFDYHDVSFLAGTIELIRQGGWLLHDVPSQYGFLNALLAASIPASSGWAALYVASGLLSSFATWLVYSALTGLGGSLLHRFGSALAVVLMLPGWAPQLTGVNFVPAVGAYRFI